MCPFCRRSSDNIHGIAECKREEDGLIDRAINHYRLRTSRKKNGIRMAILSLAVDGIKGSLNLEDFEPAIPGDEELAAIKLELARLEFVRENVPSALKSKKDMEAYRPLPLGPLVRLSYTRNMILEHAIDIQHSLLTSEQKNVKLVAQLKQRGSRPLKEAVKVDPGESSSSPSKGSHRSDMTDVSQQTEESCSFQGEERKDSWQQTESALFAAEEMESALLGSSSADALVAKEETNSRSHTTPEGFQSLMETVERSKDAVADIDTEEDSSSRLDAAVVTGSDVSDKESFDDTGLERSVIKQVDSHKKCTPNSRTSSGTGSQSQTSGSNGSGSFGLSGSNPLSRHALSFITALRDRFVDEPETYR